MEDVVGRTVVMALWLLIACVDVDVEHIFVGIIVVVDKSVVDTIVTVEFVIDIVQV